MAKDTDKRKGRKGKGAEPDVPEISVAAHPRAARAVRRMKAWGGLVGFALVGVLSWQAGVPAFEVGIRALLAGIGMYLIAWFLGLALWRQLVLAEAKAEVERIVRERDEMLKRMNAGDEATTEDEAA